MVEMLGRRATGPAAPRRLAALLLVALLASLVVALPASPLAADGNEAPGAPAPARSVTAGNGYTCSIFSTGIVRCWGENADGSLGVGDTGDRGTQPGHMLLGLADTNLGTGHTATAISAGGRHTCAVLDDGTVKCWGLNTNGQLGLGDIADRGDQPGEMGDALPTVGLGTDHTAAAIAAGASHTCALLDDGTVKCWGLNTNGQLGLGDQQARGDAGGEMGDALPTVALGAGHTATAIAAGGDHTCALLDDGTVKCWGVNDKGQLGLGDVLPRGGGPGEMGDSLPAVDLGTGRTAIALTAGPLHTCALLDNGEIKCWGESLHGRLGLGDTNDRGDQAGEMGDALPTVDLGTGRTADGVTAGDSFTCALLDDATVKCWGLNNVSQLGIAGPYRGDEPNEMGDDLPRVSLGTGRRVDAVSSGAFHTCAVLDDDVVRCWGNNDSGELGVGDTADHIGVGDAHPASALLGSAIAGHIRGTGGEPLAGGLVAALRTTDFSVAGGGRADATGMFGFAVPAGSYYLYGIEPTGSYDPGFLGDPWAVGVGSGMTIAGPALTPREGTIAGRVTDSGTGDGLAGAITMSLTSLGLAEQATTTDGNGDFTLPGLRTGPHYLITVDLSGAHAPRFHPDAPDITAATPAVTTAGAVTVSDGALPAQPASGTGAALVGRVRDTAGASVPSVLVVALRADTLALARATLTNANGGYALAVSPGDYKIGFIDPTGAHLREWYDDQPVERLDLAGTVTAPGTANAVLTPTTGGLDGTVRRNGAPVGGAWVIAIGPSGIAGATTTDAAGAYRIDDLAPGTYRAAIVHPATGRSVYWDGAAGYLDGTVFPVTAGQVTPIDPTL